MRKEYKDILTAVRRGFSVGLHVDMEFLMDCKWNGYGYCGDMDVDMGLDMVMRCSKKL